MCARTHARTHNSPRPCRRHCSTAAALVAAAALAALAAAALAALAAAHPLAYLHCILPAAGLTYMLVRAGHVWHTAVQLMVTSLARSTRMHAAPTTTRTPGWLLSSGPGPGCQSTGSLPPGPHKWHSSHQGCSSLCATARSGQSTRQAGGTRTAPAAPSHMPHARTHYSVRPCRRRRPCRCRPCRRPCCRRRPCCGPCPAGRAWTAWASPRARRACAAGR